ncbi:MAG: XRE family transcriptional regulator [Paramuribaculum sp.]|nr:XRE family transcriptional regulator [Paramuribaculum sp.]
MSEIIIGKKIEEELRKQERSVVWLADQLNCNRTNIYKIFRRDSIDTDLLLKISLVLHCNFFADYIKRLELNN